MMAKPRGDRSTCSMWNYGGFQTSDYHYLSLKDNQSVVANSPYLGKNEQFIILSDDERSDIFYLKHKERLTFLTVDGSGKVTCRSQKRGPDQSFRFSLRTSLRRWTIKSDAHDTFLVCVNGQVMATETEAENRDETWLFHLGSHPQVNLKSVKRNRYATLDVETENRVVVARKAPWGEEAIFTLELDSRGLYHIKTANDMYIHQSGRLVKSRTSETGMVLCVRAVWCCGLLFATKDKQFLSAKNSDRSLVQTKPSVATDEKFAIEDSFPQVFFTAQSGKIITVENDGSVKATMEEQILSVKEVFRLRYDEKSGQWRILSYGGCLSIDDEGRLHNVLGEEGVSKMFQLEYNDAGFVNIVGSNGKYMSENSGVLTFHKDRPLTKDMFIMTIVNKSQLILRCDVGYADFDDNVLKCNKTMTAYDTLTLLHTWGESAYYNIRASNDLYLRVEKNGSIVADSSTPKKFYLELVTPFCVAVKAPNGRYLKAKEDGTVLASAKDIKSATHWEF